MKGTIANTWNAIINQRINSRDGVKAPVKTCIRKDVEVLYGEVVANHTSLESCGSGGNITAEA